MYLLLNLPGYEESGQGKNKLQKYLDADNTIGAGDLHGKNNRTWRTGFWKDH